MSLASVAGQGLGEAASSATCSVAAASSNAAHAPSLSSASAPIWVSVGKSRDSAP